MRFHLFFELLGSRRSVVGCPATGPREQEAAAATVAIAGAAAAVGRDTSARLDTSDCVNLGRYRVRVRKRMCVAPSLRCIVSFVFFFFLFLDLSFSLVSPRITAGRARSPAIHARILYCNRYSIIIIIIRNYRYFYYYLFFILRFNQNRALARKTGPTKYVYALVSVCVRIRVSEYARQ